MPIMATDLMPVAAVDWEEAERQLEGATPWEILRWGVETFFPRLAMATAFGPEGCVLLHMLAQIEPRVRVFNLDTGYQFAETLELRDRIAERYGIEVALVQPEQSVAEYEAANGGPVYSRDPDRCCHDRKLVPLRRTLADFDAWISAIRADQSSHRARARVVGWDAKFGLVKINPLLRWTRRDVWAFIVTHKVPYNPLHDQGYPSIGCWPCTRAVASGEDERAGRWAGQAKTECGLHSLDSSQL
jgi:phosphoadenosine phosphosulfate reductase